MKTVLITGATGAIGSALVPCFLKERDTAVRLLLRAESASQLEDKVRRLRAFWGSELVDDPGEGRLQAVSGDVSRPRLGLVDRDYDRLTGETTVVVHAAGNVKLNQPLEQARKDAVDAARYVTDFAKACRRHGTFRKLEYLSTVGTAGRTPGLVPERPLGMRTFRNTYEAAKAESEDLIWREMQAGLPATIHRPSMVVGDSKTGKIIHFQVFYHLSDFLAGRKTWGIVPDTGSIKLDIIPADYVAAAIQLASDRIETSGRIFHLCSGPEFAWPLSQFAERLRQIFMRYGDRGWPLWKIRPRVMERVLPMAVRFAPMRMRPFLESLPFFLAYLHDEQTFDNSESTAFFKSAGLVVPPVDAYLETVMRYYLSATPERLGQA